MSPSLPPAPIAILFDWDNTLVDTWALLHTALNDTLATMGYPEWDLEDTKARVAHAMEHSFQEWFGPAKASEAMALYRANYQARTRDVEVAPTDGAEAMLTWIRTTHPEIRIGVVSNKYGPYLRHEVQALGWGDHFCAVVGSQDATADKPSAAPVMLALQTARIIPGAHVWFVGDTFVDMEAAHHSACTPILFGDRTPTDPTFAAYPPAYYHPDFASFLKVLQRALGHGS